MRSPIRFRWLVHQDALRFRNSYLETRLIYNGPEGKSLLEGEPVSSEMVHISVLPCRVVMEWPDRRLPLRTHEPDGSPLPDRMLASRWQDAEVEPSYGIEGQLEVAGRVLYEGGMGVPLGEWKALLHRELRMLYDYGYGGYAGSMMAELANQMTDDEGAPPHIAQALRCLQRHEQVHHIRDGWLHVLQMARLEPKPFQALVDQYKRRLFRELVHHCATRILPERLWPLTAHSHHVLADALLGAS